MTMRSEEEIKRMVADFDAQEKLDNDDYLDEGEQGILSALLWVLGGSTL